jgi:hypothetical protein
MDMGQVLKQLQDKAAAVACIEAGVLTGHGAWREPRNASIVRRPEPMMARHDRAMAEIEDKLHGLIGCGNRKPW